MLRLVRTARLFAAFVTLVCVSWIPVEGRIASRLHGVASRPMFAANTLLATLPAVLAPPIVQRSWQLVSMVTNDIDADGDLDVVANDGSLDLIVWINDGTGHLTRRKTRPASDVQPDAAGPSLAGPPESGAVLHSFFSFLEPRLVIGSVLSERSRARSDCSAETLQPAFASVRTPRAPPVSNLLS
jgi:hypothetical protein